MVNERKLNSSCKSWNRKVRRSVRRHGVEATVARLGRELPTPSVVAAWGDLVLARRLGVTCNELAEGDHDTEALTLWAVLRELGVAADLSVERGRRVVAIGGASVSARVLAFRAPTVAAAPPTTVAAAPSPADSLDEIAEPTVDADDLDSPLVWLDEHFERRSA